MKRAAALIRAHFWQPHPPGPTKDGRPWTMARELDVWRGLRRTWTPDELNGAIEHVRAVTGATGPISMRWFLRRPPLLVRAVRAWHESLTPMPRGTKRGGSFARLVVELPPPHVKVIP